MKLTRRQTEILNLIRRHIEARGAPPTRAEIARAFGFRSPNAAEQHLRALERKGAIQLRPGESRGIQLIDTIDTDGKLPLVGRVAAGNPVLASEHIEDQVAFSPEFTSCLSCGKTSRGLHETCTYCGSDKVDGITRITGYFTKLSSWNKGKIGELRDRYRNEAQFAGAC